MASPIHEALETVFAGQDLSADAAHAAMTQIMGGQATDAQIGAFLAALRQKGESVAEITGCARAMKRVAVQVRPTLNGQRLPGHLRHRRRPDRHLQHQHDRRLRRGRSRRKGSEAWQQVRQQPVRQRRCAGGVGRPTGPGPGTGSGVHRRGGHRLSVRAALPPGDEIRHRPAQRVGDAYRLQLPRPADKPGQRHPSGDRRAQPRFDVADGGCAGADGSYCRFCRSRYYRRRARCG